MSTHPGWAIRRNGSCLSSDVEVDCGQTRVPYRACCPVSTECPSQYNVACCPSGRNCTAALVETPSCANSSWNMYDNAGYFCCEKGKIGYGLDYTAGCSTSGAALPDGAVPVAIIEQVSSSTSKPTETMKTMTTVSTAPISHSPTSTTHIRSNPSTIFIASIVVGVVAGIVVIAGLLWWFCVRKKTDSNPNANMGKKGTFRLLHHDNNEAYQYTEHSAVPMPAPIEIDGTPKVAELATPGDATGRRIEIP